MATEILPAPAEAEAQTEALTGEVIDPAEVLKKNEQNIRKNFKRMETVIGSVARSLNIIYHNGLWKLHKTADGKRRYTNFHDYLETEFGWDKTAARARQIMKADLPLAIEAGDVPKEVGDKRRERTAPEITAEKAAQVTFKQIDTAWDAFSTRLDNVEAGAQGTALADIYEKYAPMMSELLDALDAFIGEATAESAEAPEVIDETA